jgi:hypothetical protein
MEEWKWEAWGAEAQKRAAEAALKSIRGSEKTNLDSVANNRSVVSMAPEEWKKVEKSPSIITLPSSQSSTNTKLTTKVQVTETPLISITVRPRSFTPAVSPSLDNMSKKVQPAQDHMSLSVTVTTNYPPVSPCSTQVTSADDDRKETSSGHFADGNKLESPAEDDSTTPVAHSTSQDPSDTPHSTILSSRAPSVTPTSAHMPKPSASPYLISSHAVTRVPSGESVFRTITNRISVLESNTTLYMQYVEIQNRSIREAIRKLEEEVGRLIGIVSCRNTNVG